MSEYPRYAPLGWPYNLDDYFNWASGDLERFFGMKGKENEPIHAYIDFLRAEGRGDEVPSIDVFVHETAPPW